MHDGVNDGIEAGRVAAAGGNDNFFHECSPLFAQNGMNTGGIAKAGAWPVFLLRSRNYNFLPERLPPALQANQQKISERGPSHRYAARFMSERIFTAVIDLSGRASYRVRPIATVVYRDDFQSVHHFFYGRQYGEF
jgi:hypothetical protein